MTKRIVLPTITGLVLIVLALILVPYVRVSQLEAGFNKVNERDTRDSVLKKMGSPWKDGSCSDYLGGNKLAGCVEEFIYAHPYAPHVPEYWEIDFDGNHRVINHVHLVSP